MLTTLMFDYIINIFNNSAYIISLNVCKKSQKKNLYHYNIVYNGINRNI